MATWSQSLPGKRPTHRSGGLDLFWSEPQIERPVSLPQSSLQYEQDKPLFPELTDENALQREEVETAKAAVRSLKDQQVNGAFYVLSALYEVPNKKAVRLFLARRRPLRVLLFDAYPRIKKIFGERASTELKLIEDMDDNLDRLRVSIVTNRGDARQALERFDEEWWLDHVQCAEGLLDFVLRRE